jgi:imidazole glycerol phosphate synthase subunit HisF
MSSTFVTVGGGIRTVSDVGALLESGADKISINSAAVRNKSLIGDLAREFGSHASCVRLIFVQIAHSILNWALGGKST